MRTKRWLFAVDGMLALLFLGLIYAWSVFSGTLKAEFALSDSEASLTFSISMALFCIGGLVGGFLARKVPPRVVMIIAAVFILAGFNLASLIDKDAGLFIFNAQIGLYVCYGFLCGFGVGMGYNAVLNGVLKWFPDMQGLLSGVLLMGFGFGGTVLGSVAGALMNSLGWRMTFRVLGIALAALIVLSSLLLRQPTAQDLAEIGGPAGGRKLQLVEDVPTGKLLRTRSFWMYFVWAALLSSVGLAIIGSANPFAKSLSDGSESALFMVGLVGGLVNICNGLGRLSFGFLLDILGTKKCLLIINCGLIVSMLVLMGAIATGSLAILAVGFILTGLSFGGVTPSNSAYISKVFGQKYYPLNFSMINMQLIIASFLGPYSLGITQDLSGGGYMTGIILMLVFCVVSVPVMLLINRHAPGRAKREAVQTEEQA